MEDNRYTRFRDAIWFTPNNPKRVLVGGCGGIGSWLTVLLNRAGFAVTVFDDDVVTETNLGGQFFNKNDLGKLKVTAVQNHISYFNDSSINAVNGRIDQDHKIPYCVNMLSGFDNMEARRDLFEFWKSNYYLNYVRPIFIDGRLLMNQLQIFCITKESQFDLYDKKFLFGSEEVEPASCTLRQTSHTAAMIAAKMVGFFTNHITNVNLGEEIAEVPFYYEYEVTGNITEVIV